MQDDQIAPTTIDQPNLPYDPKGVYPDGTADSTMTAIDETAPYEDRPTSIFSIPCAITRGYFRVEGETYPRHEESGKFYPFSRIGESKWRFDWIHEEDTHVCELPTGMKIEIVYTEVTGHFEILSKRVLVSMIHAPQLYECVRKAIRNGAIRDGVTYAIVPGATNIYRKLGEPIDYIRKVQTLNEAVSLDTLMSKYRYAQWHVGSKTVDSVSKWLMEDLTSRLKTKQRYAMSGKEVYDAYNDMEKPQRPDGLLFFNKGLDKMARIMCKDFEWYHGEGQACKETHAYEVHILGKSKDDFPGLPELTPLDIG